MAKVDQAAKSVQANFCADSLHKLAAECIAASKSPKVGTALAPIALAAFFRAVAARLEDGPIPTAQVTALEKRLRPLLTEIARSGIQQSDRFNHLIDDQLLALKDLIH